MASRLQYKVRLAGLGRSVSVHHNDGGGGGGGRREIKINLIIVSINEMAKTSEKKAITRPMMEWEGRGRLKW